MSAAFTAALRATLQTRGLTWGWFGGTGLTQHMKTTSCTGWVIPEGSKAVPDTTYEFAGTDQDPDTVHTVALNTRVDCACGEFKDKKIYLEGTMGEIMTQLLKIPVPGTVEF